MRSRTNFTSERIEQRGKEAIGEAQEKSHDDFGVARINFVPSGKCYFAHGSV